MSDGCGLRKARYCPDAAFQRQKNRITGQNPKRPNDNMTLILASSMYASPLAVVSRYSRILFSPNWYVMDLVSFGERKVAGGGGVRRLFHSPLPIWQAFFPRRTFSPNPILRGARAEGSPVRLAPTSPPFVAAASRIGQAHGSTSRQGNFRMLEKEQHTNSLNMYCSLGARRGHSCICGHA